MNLIYPVAEIQPNVFSNDKYFLKKPLIIEFWDPKPGEIERVVIPSGFSTDGASIPRLLWSLLGINPFSPKIITAAICHDFIFNPIICKNPREADGLMIKICKEHGMSKWHATMVHIGLTLGSWIPFYFTSRYSKKKLKAMSEAELMDLTTKLNLSFDRVSL